jgi:hypothetical protein
MSVDDAYMVSKYTPSLLILVAMLKLLIRVENSTEY